MHTCLQEKASISTVFNKHMGIQHSAQSILKNVSSHKQVNVSVDIYTSIMYVCMHVIYTHIHTYTYVTGLVQSRETVE